MKKLKGHQVVSWLADEPAGLEAGTAADAAPGLGLGRGCCWLRKKARAQATSPYSVSGGHSSRTSCTRADRLSASTPAPTTTTSAHPSPVQPLACRPAASCSSYSGLFWATFGLEVLHGGLDGVQHRHRQPHPRPVERVAMVRHLGQVAADGSSLSSSSSSNTTAIKGEGGGRGVDLGINIAPRFPDVLAAHNRPTPGQAGCAYVRLLTLHGFSLAPPVRLVAMSSTLRLCFMKASYDASTVGPSLSDDGLARAPAYTHTDQPRNG